MNIKLDYSTLQEKVISSVREAILKQVYKPGERLIQENLANTLGVSRMPVREALRRLEMEGLVKLVPHKGAFVIPISSEDMEEMYELRALLEGYAVERSIGQLAMAAVSRLDELAELMKKNAENRSVDEYIRNNREFHLLLRSGYKGKRTEMMIQQLWNGYPSYAPRLLPHTMEQSNVEHQAMLEAVKKSDAKEARKLMEMHIRRTGNALRKRLC